MSKAADLPLDELALALAPGVVAAAAFDGWSEAAVTAAAGELGVAPEVARLAFAGGPMAMIAAWIAHIDALMARDLPAETLATIPVRARIRRLVGFRLEMLAGHEEALRRALAIMAMPRNLARSARLGWASADRMWRLAGDSAADFNHYTKRATLAGIYAACLHVFVDDASAGKAETLAFLDRRIEGVMRFEQAKARLAAASDLHFSPARFLGRLRYPAR